MRSVFLFLGVFVLSGKNTASRCVDLQDEVGGKQRTCRWQYFWSEVSTKIHSCAPVVCVCSRLGVTLMECDSANSLWREKAMLQSYCMTWHFLVLSCFSFQSFFLFCLQMNISNVPTDMIYAHVLLINWEKQRVSKRNTKNQSGTAGEVIEHQRLTDLKLPMDLTAPRMFQGFPALYDVKS